MTHPYWPLFDLRLATADLTMRPMTEMDRLQVAECLPADLELDPAATSYEGVPEAVNRGIISFQSYWKCYGNWSPDSWNLPFAVFLNDELIGSQSLEGERFPILREVDSSSFLLPDFRGKGFGKQMRQAVLALAFDRLGAASAITSAWHDNDPSLGVSSSLGYVSNGETRHLRGDRVDRMLHMRLSRETWLARGYSAGVTIEGFEACRPLFGLG